MHANTPQPTQKGTIGMTTQTTTAPEVRDMRTDPITIDPAQVAAAAGYWQARAAEAQRTGDWGAGRIEAATRAAAQAADAEATAAAVHAANQAAFQQD